MSKNAPMPTNCVSFSVKNRDYWLGLILADPNLTQRQTLIAATMAKNIRFQHGYGGWLMNSSYGYVINQLENGGVAVNKDEVAAVLKQMVDLGYISKFKVGKGNEYYFTDPTK